MARVSSYDIPCKLFKNMLLQLFHEFKIILSFNTRVDYKNFSLGQYKCPQFRKSGSPLYSGSDFKTLPCSFDSGCNFSP